MTKRMLIDATHAEETRVVVLDGNRLEDFDVETSTKKQLKGNIYLAKVVRVEPSLQAAFVEYGGGRHGFLAFGEIHPDYYQIPVADRQRLLEIAAEEAREEEEAEERREAGWAVKAEPRAQQRRQEAHEIVADEIIAAAPEAVVVTEIPISAEAPPEPEISPPEPETAPPPAPVEMPAEPVPVEIPAEPGPEVQLPDDQPEIPRSGPAQAALIPTETRYGDADAVAPEAEEALPPGVVFAGDAEGVVDDETLPEAAENDNDGTIESTPEDAPPPEQIGGESDQFEGNGAEEASRRRSSRMLRNYRIQEVIRRRQILLIQVVKEERGTKGAALTTYISLAGRYCVLMPNSPRGGGISRKITSSADRKRLKEITNEMEIPKGMGLIVRTAGANRPKPEIRRDCEYLMRLWDDIREHTLRSTAPALIYEEASLIKRSIRDVYSRDVDEIIVDGEEGWRQAHDFMRMLMPSHAKKVQLWRPQGVAMPLFAKHQVDLQLDAMLAPTVQLRSGGYLVINQTEALVAIDVNSGRSTRERGIEETALKTNLEAADEVGRQLRLRDLAGLIVIDFIDMEARKHNAMVERRMKDALKNDRARIQLGSISHFGLLEMSRQRLRPSLAETSFVMCPHCNGLGHVRSIESSAIHVLRAVEEEGAKLRAASILVHAAAPVVMYILNNKRDRLGEIEARYAMRVSFAGDDTLLAPAVRIDRLRPQVPEAERLLAAAPVAVAARPMEDYDDADEDDIVNEDDDEPVARAPVAAKPAGQEPTKAEAAATEEAEQRKRRRRRRRGGRRDNAAPGDAATDASPLAAEGDEEGDEAAVDAVSADELPEDSASEADLTEALTETQAEGGALPANEAVELDENGEPKSRRRGRRGGRRRRRGEAETGAEAGTEEAGDAEGAAVAATVAALGETRDIFELLEEAPPAVAPEPVAAAAEAPAAMAVAEPEVVAEPAVKPIVIGESPAADAPAKKGWWRR